MEGYLPLTWCIVWFVISIIVVAFGIYQIKKIVDETPESKALLAVSGALKLTGRKTWSVFENLFIAYNPEEYNTESLQAYYKTHAEAQDGNLKHKYETDDDCKQIRKEFARNNF